MTTTANQQEDDILEPQETSAYIKVPLRTLDQWRYRRTGPAYMKIGRHIRYRRTDLDSWLDAQRVTPNCGDPRA